MKNVRRTILISIAVFALVACSKKDETKSETSGKTEDGKGAAKAGGDSEKKAEPKAATLSGEGVKLAGLKLGGSGFDGEFNKALESWTFEKWEPQKGGGNEIAVRIYADVWSADWPADADGFATKLGGDGYLDMGSKWTKIDNKEAFDGGWVITGDNFDGEDTEKAFVVQLTKLKLICRGFIKPKAKDQAASQADAIAACKAATL